MDQKSLKRQKTSNSFQSAIIILAMAVISGVVGWMIAGWVGFIVAIAAAIFLSFFAARISPAIVLRMYHAREITARNAPELHAIFVELCRRAKLESLPRLYYIPSRMMNAFAIGSDKNAAVALTDGILRVLRPREIAGVLGHEISHIRHDDIKVLSTADIFSRVTGLISRVGLFIALGSLGWFLLTGQFSYWIVKGPILFAAPVFNVMLLLALSRSREFNADLGAVELTGDVDGMISALQRIHRSVSAASGILVPGRRRMEPALLRTHPPLEQRVRELREVAPKISQSEVDPIEVIQARHLGRQVVKPVRRTARWHPTNGLWY